MKKKKSKIIILFIVLLIGVYMVGSGFQTRIVGISDEFTISEEGRSITFSVEAISSMGFVRGYTDKGGGEKPHYLKFYSAWGGFNSSIGAKKTYTLPLSEEDREIYIYHGDGGYTLVFAKDIESGRWKKVSKVYER